VKFNSFFSTLLLLYACSLSPRTGTQTIAGLAQVDKARYTANIQEKNSHQNELILDGDSTKEYGNTPPNRTSDQVAIFYQYRNKPQVYIHTKIQRKKTLLYM
jgi:hypothetical protein